MPHSSVAPPVAESPPRVAAVIPAWNEAGAIGASIATLPRDIVQAIVVVDGGSTDTTVAEARDAGATVIVQTRRGYGAACAEGAARAAADGAEIVLFMDGDGADAGELCDRLIAPVRDGVADFAIATRGRAGREPGSMLWHQVLAGDLIGRAVGVATGVRYHDMGPFRAIRVETLARLGMRQMGFGWNLEMQMRAAAAGLRIVQVPMPYRCRIAGASKVAGSLSGTLRASGRIVVTLIELAVELRGQRRAAKAGGTPVR